MGRPKPPVQPQALRTGLALLGGLPGAASPLSQPCSGISGQTLTLQFPAVEAG